MNLSVLSSMYVCMKKKCVRRRAKSDFYKYPPTQHFQQEIIISISNHLRLVLFIKALIVVIICT